MRVLIPPAVLLVAATAFAQLHESMTVEVIEVPVYVSAPDGTPVRGLPRDAFRLYVNGKPHPIDYFDAVDFGAAPAAPQRRAEARRDLRQRRLYLFLFDLAYTRAGYIARAQQAADVAVGRSDPNVDYFAVATYTHDGGVTLVTPFSNDHVVVRRAIETLTPGNARDPLRIGMASEQRAKWARIEARAKGLPLSETFESESNDPEAAEKVRGGIANQELSREPMKNDVNREMARIGNAAALLAGLEGQKHVVIFSAGYDPSLIADKGPGFGEDPQMRRFMESMIDEFRRAGAFLDAIGVVGQRSGNEDEALRRMAEPTGGTFVRNANDIGAALNRLTTSQQAVYLLGFRRRDLTQGDIEVKVDGMPRGARVSFRTGFGKPSAHDVNALQLADIIENDIPQNGLSAHLGINPAPGGVDVAVLFRPAEVAAQLVPEKPWLEVVLYVFDEHGGTALSTSKRVPFDGSSKVAVAGVRERAKLAPGRYVAKALLRVGGTDSLGFAKEAFEVK